MEKEIESAKKKLKEKYNFEFPYTISIGDGIGASTREGRTNIGKENPLEVIEIFVLHEAYHMIFNIDQTKAFKEKDKGNPMPYFKQEMFIWNKIKKDFPELSPKVDSAIVGEMIALGILK